MGSEADKSETESESYHIGGMESVSESDGGPSSLSRPWGSTLGEGDLPRDVMFFYLEIHVDGRGHAGPVFGGRGSVSV